MTLSRLVYVLLLLVGASWVQMVGAQDQDEAVRRLKEDLARPRPHRLQMNKGKGYVLCETLLKTAQRLHPKGEYRRLEPLLTWKAIFGIPGITEPPWIDLDPLQYEALTAKLHQLYDLHSTPYSGTLNAVDVFFALDRYPCLKARPINCNISRGDRLKTTLEGYRDFARSGGRMRMYSLDIGSKEAPFPAALIQYEYPRPPDWSNRTEWLGFTFYATENLSDRIVNDAKNVVDVGPDRRLVLYRGRPHIINIEATPYLLAKYAAWPYWECEIVSLEIGTRP